jgi:hypothetical protein
MLGVPQQTNLILTKRKKAGQRTRLGIIKKVKARPRINTTVVKTKEKIAESMLTSMKPPMKVVNVRVVVYLKLTRRLT